MSLFASLNPQNAKNNLTATVAPGVTDDIDSGYTVGSRWIDVTGDEEYVCLDRTAGAAVWGKTTTAGEGGGISNVVEDTTPQLGGDLDLNTFNLDANQVPTVTQKAQGIIGSVTVDANATGIGALLHRDTDGNFIEADADAATTMPASAIALESGTGSKKVLFYGFYRDDTAFAFTQGQVLYASTTAGAITGTAPTGSGDQVQVLGVAVSADVIHFTPSMELTELV